MAGRIKVTDTGIDQHRLVTTRLAHRPRTHLLLTAIEGSWSEVLKGARLIKRTRHLPPVAASDGVLVPLAFIAVPVIWGIHNDQPTLDLIGGGFVSIGWEALGDLHRFEHDKDALKEALADAHPEAKAGAIPVWAGVLHRFAFEIQPGDIVVAPNKADSTINLGRVIGDYYWDTDADVHPSRRHVEWLRTGVPRVAFTKTARNEIGSAVTLFRVKRHADEFLKYLSNDTPTGDGPVAIALTDDAALETAEDEPNAERIETYTRDFIIEKLYRDLDPYRFEHFTAAVLRAMGYQARVTQASGDGGVDVIAYRDALGLEPPIVKVQCKRMLGTIGGPDIQKLAGTLATVVPRSVCSSRLARIPQTRCILNGLAKTFDLSTARS